MLVLVEYFSSRTTLEQRDTVNERTAPPLVNAALWKTVFNLPFTAANAGKSNSEHYTALVWRSGTRTSWSQKPEPTTVFE